MKAIKYLSAGVMALGILGFGGIAFGQFEPEMRWQPSSGDYPVEYNEGTPVITIDGVLTDPVSVTLELELLGWGWSVPPRELRAYGATINATGYASGDGDDLVFSGAEIHTDHSGFVFREYVSPVIPGCPLVIDGWPSAPWLMGASIAPCSVADQPLPAGYGGTVTIEVPTGAAGWYQIPFLDFVGPYPSEPVTFMLDSSGALIQPVVMRPVVIEIPMGSCCYSIGEGTTQCEDDITETQCAALPSPWAFQPDASCTGDICVDCAVPDCNENGIADECDIADCVNDPACDDCNDNDVPDECEVPPIDPDAPDCQPNGVPDECELPPIDPDAPDCNDNGIPDGCEADCNGTGIADECEVPPIDPGAPDCQPNLVPDECELDCQPNGMPDECDIIYGTSPDLNHNDVPDECEPEPCEAEELDNLFASDGETGDSFGEAVAMSGDTAVIGTPQDDYNGDQSGSAYVFRFDGTEWVEEDRLVASDGTSGDRFGNSVAIDGDVAVIGAYRGSGLAPWSGVAYVYRRAGSIWVQEQELDAFDGGFNDSFGYSVGVSGDIAVIGARYNATGTD
ncbi:MAG: FG-GAP repeat protein [Planctomycetota bacterium]